MICFLSRIQHYPKCFQRFYMQRNCSKKALFPVSVPLCKRLNFPEALFINIKSSIIYIPITIKSATVPCLSLTLLLTYKAGFCTITASIAPIINGSNTPRQSFKVIISKSPIIERYATNSKNFFFFSFSVKIPLSVDFYVKIVYNNKKCI